MYKFVLILFLSLSTSFAFALGGRSSPAVMALENYMRANGSAKTLAVDTISEGYNVLGAYIKDGSVAEAAKISQVFRLTVLLLKADPSQYAAEVAHPFYLKNKKIIQERFKNDNSPDVQLFKDGFSNYERELRDGNG